VSKYVAIYLKHWCFNVAVFKHFGSTISGVVLRSEHRQKAPFDVNGESLFSVSVVKLNLCTENLNMATCKTQLYFREKTGMFFIYAECISVTPYT